jgi:uncharacterized protein YrrD
MDFKHGVSVFTAEGDKVGSIEQVVVDPRTEEVTHVVVKEGFLFTEDKVLPTDLIATATDERVTLKEGVEDLETMPKFEEPEYIEAVVPSDTPSPPAAALYAQSAWPIYYLPPDKPGERLIPRWSEIYKPKYVRRTERNVPEGSVVLDDNAKVMSSDFEHVGDVAEVFTDADDEHITHLLISRGLLFKQERCIPVSWIDRVGEETIHLAVESSLLKRLPPYCEDPDSDSAAAEA